MTISKNILASFVFISTIVSGCASIPIPFVHFVGYDSPPENKLSVATSNTTGPIFYNQNLSMEQKEILDEIAQDVSVVLNSDEFKQELQGKSFNSGCNSENPITGEEVIKDLSTVSHISVVAIPPFGAIAQADINRHAFAVKPSRLKNWREQPSLRPDTIDTFIHEMTHFVDGREDMSKGKPVFKYIDTGHKKQSCKLPPLVSYSVGHAAKEAYTKLKDSNQL